MKEEEEPTPEQPKEERSTAQPCSRSGCPDMVRRGLFPEGGRGPKPPALRISVITWVVLGRRKGGMWASVESVSLLSPGKTLCGGGGLDRRMQL